MDPVTAANEPQSVVSFTDFAVRRCTQSASPERSTEHLAQAASARERDPSQTASSPPSHWPDAGAGGDASAGASGALALAPPTGSDDPGYAADSEDEHESDATNSAPTDEHHSSDGESDAESEDCCASEDQPDGNADSGPADDGESRSDGSDAEDGGACDSESGDDGWGGHADSNCNDGDSESEHDDGHAGSDEGDSESEHDGGQADSDDCEAEDDDDGESEDDDCEAEGDDDCASVDEGNDDGESEDEGDDGSEDEHGSEDDRAALDALAPTARNRRKRTLDEDEQPAGKRARVGRSMSEAIYGQAGRISVRRQWPGM